MNPSGPAQELESLRANVTRLEHILHGLLDRMEVQASTVDHAEGEAAAVHVPPTTGLHGGVASPQVEALLTPLVWNASQTTGENFFRVFVRALAIAFGVQHACVGEILPNQEGMLRIIAHWRRGAWGAPYDYVLTQSPIEEALLQGEAVYPRHRRAWCLEDTDEPAPPGESFAGMTVRNSSGEPLGVVFMIGHAPLDNVEAVQTVFRTFAERAGAELERMQTERALRESQARYARATAAGKVGVWEVDVQRGVYHSDPNLKGLLGYADADLSSNPFDWLELVVPDDQEVAAQEWHRVATGQTDTYHCELRMRHKTGSVLWTQVRGHARKDEHGRLVSLLGSTVDISERKLAEEGLRESEERYRLIFEAIPDPLLVVGFDEVVRDANPAACRTYGYQREHLIGTPVIRLMHADARPQWTQALQRLSGGHPCSMVSMDIRRDGTPFPVEVHVSPFRYRGEAVMLNSIRDITERRVAESALRESEQNLRKSERDLRLVLDSLPVGVWLTDPRGHVVLSNPLARRIWCGSAQAVSEGEDQRQWERWTRQCQPHREALEQALRTGAASLQDTMAIQCLDGTVKRVRHTVVPARGENGTIMGAIVVNEDMTERTLLEEQAQLFRTLMDHSSDAVFMFEPESGRVLDVNASACHHLGYRREELLGLGAMDIEEVLPDKQAWDDLVTGLRQAGSRTLTGWHRRKDGAIFPVEVNAGFVRLSRGDFIVAVSRDISDRERAEEQLRQSEERFRTLIEYSSDIITVVNPDATIRYESPAFYRLFGYREEEVLGRNAFEMVHPDDLERTMGIFRERLHTPGLADPVVFGFRKADGGYLTLEVVGNNLLHEPNIQGIVVNCREVTERIRAQEALQASEAKLRTLADHAPVAIFMSDSSGQCVYVNQRWCDMTGYEARDAYGSGWLRMLPPDEQARLTSRWLADGSSAGPPIQQEYRYITKHGVVRWAEGSIVPLYNSQNVVTGFISTSTDITERRRAEEELRQSHAFIRHVIDTDPNLIFAKDREGRFTLVNKAVADFYGTTVEHLIGKTDADVNGNTSEVVAVQQQDLDVLNTLSERFIAEEILTDSAGRRRWLQTVKRPLLDEHGRATQVLGASTDITARKEVEEALRQREQALQAALAERERISEELHDGLLQSLYAVGLGLETSKSLMKRNAKRAVQALDRAVTQLNAVMREVRNFIAGLESELLQGGDLSRALRAVIESLASPHGLPFRVAIQERAMHRITREQGLHALNVVREAVSNSLRHARANSGSVSVRGLKHAVRITIRDDGIGFEPRAAIGLGHGLINMEARAKRIGGHLIIDSKPNRGTRIVFDLPKEDAHGRA